MADSETPARSVSELKLLISQAERLGFWDDVVHWQTELANLQESTL